MGATMIRWAALLCALTVLAVSPALAGTFTLGKPPIATVTIPDSWQPDLTDDGVESLSPDKSVYLSIEVKALGDGTELALAMKEAVDWVEEQGATLTERTPASDATVNGWQAIAAQAFGRDADGNPTAVDVVGVIINQTAGLVMLSWYDPRRENNAATVRRIVQSLKPPR
jgi:hypothetical protein